MDSIKFESMLLEQSYKIDEQSKCINACISTIDMLSKIVKEQNQKINKMATRIRVIDSKISQTTERELNQQIRQYSMKHNPGLPTNFVPSKVIPLSKIFE